ncbi:MAG: PIN domain-containing protein [Nitrososphaerales archaeon]
MKIKVDGKDVADTEYAQEKILLDTNLLVFAHNRGSPHYAKASRILVASLQDALRLYISTQSVLEFFSVMTNPRKIKPTPSSQDVTRICSDLLLTRKIRKIFPQTATGEAIEIAEKKSLRGPQIFDCLLAVTAKQNQIDRIWTENLSDFKYFEELVAVENPLEMEWELVHS